MKTGIALANGIFCNSSPNTTLNCWWLGQMSFVVKCGDITLLLDPYLTDSPKRLIPPLLEPALITGADYIFGTHDHGDHIDRPVWPLLEKASPRARFVVPRLLSDRLSRALNITPDKLIAIEEDCPFEECDISIRGIPSAHELLNPDPLTGDHPAMGYLIKIGGFRVYHAGDCCIYDGLTRALTEAGHIDLMILPINGRDAVRYRRNIIGNMTYQEAVDLAGTVAPGLVIPGHYDMFEFNRCPGDAMNFAEYMEAKYPDQPYLLPAHGERFTVG